ncbi:MAG: tyrosine-type recombinase/integrase [Gammaproteobacteria bacterium]
MSIIKCGTNSYRVSISKTIDGEIFRFDKRYKTRKEAQAGEREFLYNLDIGNKPTKCIDFVQYGQSYIDSLDGISDRTKESYQAKFNYLKDYFNHPISSFTNTKIKRLLSKIKKDKDLSNLSMNHIFKIMKRIFRQASLDFGINDPSGTFYVTTSYKVQKKKKGALTNAEQESFIKYLADRQDNKLFAKQEYIFGLIALSTGLRRGELAGLNWENIDLDNKILHVTQAVAIANKVEQVGSPKTEAGIRSIQMDNYLVSELRKYKTFLQRFFMTSVQFNTGWLFPKLDGETRTPITCWCQRMAKVFKVLDIKHSMHSLRHTHASNLLMNNYPVLQLSHRLGHADPSITLSIYSHLVKGQELDVNNYLPNIGLKQVN